MTPTDRSAPREPPIRIGVSACLLGQQVRFDGGHRRNQFLVDVLGRFVEFVPVCPEVELGLGVPRETLSLVGAGGEVRLIADESGADHTVAMRKLSERRTSGLAAEDLSGYVLKKNSPSCGMKRVRVHANGTTTRDGRGFFANALMRRYPNLPVAEEDELSSPRLREHFIERVFAHRRLRIFFSARWTVTGLAAFHNAHKLQLLAHSPKAHAALALIVANARSIDRTELRQRYEREFMAALAGAATIARHASVLQRISRCFIDRLDPDARRELVALIEEYRRGLIPLIVPITLMRHYTRRFAIADLSRQVYLAPHPKELMLRNHI
jgi:uncharacterized protein YbbK (DUF523 family)/uncharacterized protein YbgA (DUF1722 family)